jgi:hypothetical protein
MSEVVICRHCEESFALQPGKPGYRDECPSCLIERTLRAAKPDKSGLEEHFATSGLTSEQIARSVDRFRREMGKLFRAWGWSEAEIHRDLYKIESSPIPKVAPDEKRTKRPQPKRTLKEQ